MDMKTLIGITGALGLVALGLVVASNTETYPFWHESAGDSFPEEVFIPAMAFAVCVWVWLTAKMQESGEGDDLDVSDYARGFRHRRHTHSHKSKSHVIHKRRFFPGSLFLESGPPIRRYYRRHRSGGVLVC